MITTIGTRPDGTKFWADPAKMHTYIDCKLETREPTSEEMEELRIPEAIITISIPEDVYTGSQEIQSMILNFRMLYSGLDIRTYEGYTHIGNIDLADIKKYVSKEQYLQLQAVGTKFPPEVVAFFSEATEAEPVDSDNTPENSEPLDTNPSDDDKPTP